MWIVLLLVLLPTLVSAGPITNLRGTTDTWIPATGSTITNGGGILAGPITITSAGYQQAKCEFNATGWATAVAANAVMNLWVCGEVDGTNYEDCDTTNFSQRRPDAVFPLRAGGTGPQRIMQVIVMTPGNPKALLQNLSGVTLNTGATLKCQPFTPTQ